MTQPQDTPSTTPASEHEETVEESLEFDGGDRQNSQGEDQLLVDRQQLPPEDTLIGDSGGAEVDSLDQGYAPPETEPERLRPGYDENDEIGRENLDERLAEERPDTAAAPGLDLASDAGDPEDPSDPDDSNLDEEFASTDAEIELEPTQPDLGPEAVDEPLVANDGA